MVGIVIVSHSVKLAEGVVDLARLMAADAPMRAAGGMDDGGFGTSFEKISNAIDEIYTDDGVIILMDLGSAVMTTEMVIEMMQGRKLKMVDCPLAEGAVAASVVAEGGAPLEDVVEAAVNAGKIPKF